MTTKIAVGPAFTDNTLPMLTAPDSMLTAGSLFLVDMTNSQKPAAAGVPASGSRIPNLAWVAARNMIGSGDEVSLAPTWSNDLALPHGKVERSAKGGLHGMIKKQAYTSSYTANLANGLVSDWIKTHPTHSFFMSLWGVYTAVDGGSGSGFGSRMVGINQAAADYFSIRKSGGAGAVAMVPTTNRIGSRPKANQDLVPFIVNGAQSQLTGTPADSQTLAIWQTGPTTGGQVVQPSWVLYRMYIEDLTVSGRSYATLDALDLARYTAEVATAGGRYFGDTYSNPAAL